MGADAPQVAAVILAAGGSTRFGAPKQLLKIGAESLLEHTCRVVQEAGVFARVFVVLGAHSAPVRPLLASPEVQLVINPDWATGLSTSVQAGLAAALGWDSRLESLLFTLVDQPHLTGSTLRKLVAAGVAKTGCTKLVAARYGGHPGAPCWVHASMFAALRQLRGDEGIRPLFQHLPAGLLEQIELPELALDIDTPEDYRRFLAEG